MQRFTGMTRPVAEFLANKVFCILEDTTDDSQRIEARDFGVWVKDLPALFSTTTPSGHKRVVSTSSTQGFPLAPSAPPSRRPSSRNSFSLNVPAVGSHPRSRAPSLRPTFEIDASELSTVFDQDLDEQDEQEEDEMYSRSPSTNKRRKRGARKGKGTSTPAHMLPGSALDHTLQTLATASQSLAREISKASRTSSTPRGEPEEPPALPPLPIMPTPVPVVAKKTSKWKLGFGKNNSGEKAIPSPVDELPPLESSKPMSATASNVTNLIMGLSAPVPPTARSIPQSRGYNPDEASTWSRGRRPSATPTVTPHTVGPARSRQGSPPSMFDGSAYLAPQHKFAAPRAKSPRAMSPGSGRSGRPVASSASSMASSNWRTSTSSASSSAFTKYSNNSARSVSTTATSVSAQSWRTQTSQQTKSKQPVHADPVQQAIPRNIKSKLYCLLMRRTHFAND